MNDVNCLKAVNTIVSKELEMKYRGDYDLNKKDIKIMMKFYIDKTGKPDSILFVKSNLREKGIREELIISELMQHNYKCLRETYYAYIPTPDGVTIIFNPELID